MNPSSQLLALNAMAGGGLWLADEAAPMSREAGLWQLVWERSPEVIEARKAFQGKELSSEGVGDPWRWGQRRSTELLGA
jgi:hypothetical protein